MRVKPLVTVTSLFFAFLLSASVVTVAQAAGQDSSEPQEVIQKVFPNSKITWSKEIQGEMVNFRATSTALAIMIGNGDKRKLRFVNFKDLNEWSIDCDYKSCRYYDVIGNEEPNLLIQGIKAGGPFTTLYSGEGEILFNLELDSWVYPSTNLEYFHTTQNSDSYNLLKVYDIEGKFMWTRRTPHGMMWFTQALSDTELIYIDYKGCFLLNSLTGEEIWKIPSEKYFPFISGFLEIYPAYGGKYFIVEDDYTIISVNNDGEILWMKKTSMNILAVSISENGRYIALYQEKLDKSGVKKLELFDNFEKGEILWSKSIEIPIEDISSKIHGLKIKGKEISLIPDFVSYYVAKGVTPQMKTFYFIIDSEKGTLLDQRITEGVAETFQYGGKVLSYILIDKDTHKEIFRIEQDKIK